MAQNLHITFKAGLCETSDRSSSSSDPRHVKPLPTPGYIYLFTEDDLLHFCWRPRSAPASQPDLDLIMFAGDGSFEPYQQHGSKYSSTHNGSSPPSSNPTNGRIYVLSFSSSSDRHVFWLQSQSQSSTNDPSWHSPRDLKIAELVNKLLEGDEINAQQEMVGFTTNGSGPSDGDGDTAMEDGDGAPPEGDGRPRGMSGGAGADATGGDVREEGEEAREGGADGGRAAAAGALSGNANAQLAVSNFLQSLQGGNMGASSQSSEGPSFTSLPELLKPNITTYALASWSEDELDALLSLLPPTLIMLASIDDIEDMVDVQNTDADTVEAVKMSLSMAQKKHVLISVLRSPQFSQSLSSLTSALADGGLPTISEALGVPAENKGYVKGGTVPLGGADAINAFLDGIRKKVEKEEKGEPQDDSNERMDT